MSNGGLAKKYLLLEPDISSIPRGAVRKMLRRDII